LVLVQILDLVGKLYRSNLD